MSIDSACPHGIEGGCAPCIMRKGNTIAAALAMLPNRGRCNRRVEVVRQAPANATGFDGIDMRGIRPCGGRIIDGKCEFCDVTTIEERR